MEGTKARFQFKHMVRIKLEIPNTLIASFLIPVRIGDINYGNHVGNDAIVSIIHEARVQWLHKYGFTELDINGTGLIMSDLAIEFKKESFYGDLVEIKIYCGETGRVNFDLFYELSAIRAKEPVLFAKAKTGMVCYDYMGKKVVEVPAELMLLLKSN